MLVVITQNASTVPSGQTTNTELAFWKSQKPPLELGHHPLVSQDCSCYVERAHQPVSDRLKMSLRPYDLSRRLFLVLDRSVQIRHALGCPSYSPTSLDVGVRLLLRVATELRGGVRC